MASPGKKSFLLRIDPAIWAEIERLAAQELRSSNAQVEYLLRQALVQRGRSLPADNADNAGEDPSASE
ncbi:hypothetical protein [Undibacterium terreum]|uniref:Toxin-antitoxin system HicB family antitoxin n=1 Tax=Undibacterium terreum TaxID=1224302 RepID=A0A916UVF0_9BURK|nr:hypothetical protein [Undibacterium terreum]GGC88935.1 hypothetical protein GCM10011396_40190 [Undibacterium terreum]